MFKQSYGVHIMPLVILGVDTHAQTHISTSRTQTILRNQTHASLCLAHTWFNNVNNYYTMGCRLELQWSFDSTVTSSLAIPLPLHSCLSIVKFIKLIGLSELSYSLLHKTFSSLVVFLLSLCTRHKSLHRYSIKVKSTIFNSLPVLQEH